MKDEFHIWERLLQHVRHELTNDREGIARNQAHIAERLWEEAEIRRLSSPWTTPTRFEGKVREHFMRKARASGGQHD